MDVLGDGKQEASFFVLASELKNLWRHSHNVFSYHANGGQQFVIIKKKRLKWSSKVQKEGMSVVSSAVFKMYVIFFLFKHCKYKSDVIVMFNLKSNTLQVVNASAGM